MPTPQEIVATFAAAELEISFERAAAVARHIGQWGANARAAVNPDGAGLGQVGLDYLTYLQALEEAHDVGKRAARMRREAASLNRSADHHLTTAIDYEGMIAAKRRNGDDYGAQALEDIARACMKAHAQAEEKAFALNLRAAELEIRDEFSRFAVELAVA